MLALLGQINEQLVDLILTELVIAASLAHVDALSVRRRFIKQYGVGQRIKNDHISALEQISTCNGNEVWIAWSCADQTDASCGFFGLCCQTE